MAYKYPTVAQTHYGWTAEYEGKDPVVDLPVYEDIEGLDSPELCWTCGDTLSDLGMFDCSCVSIPKKRGENFPRKG